jgi:hypothetical protein
MRDKSRVTSVIAVPLAVSLLLCLLLGSTVEAADDRSPLASKPLDIHVQAGAFDRVAAADIAAVLRSAGGEIWRYCPGIQIDGIDVYRRTDHPQINFKKTSGGRIAIGLAAQDGFWAQYSFQFAHEFCHLLANYSDNQHSLRNPAQANANLWLEESLCETASLFTLRAMSRSWQTAPPHPDWKSYAPWFGSYAEKRLALPENHLPAGMPFSVWFRENQSALRLNPTMRDRNTIIAIQCLPLFEAEPSAWKTLAFLNRDFAIPNESLTQHFIRWQSHCPEELQPFIRRLATIFEVRL